MSSSDQTPEPVPVRVTADPGTEIFVIDHTFDLKARGLQNVNESLLPGIYKFKFKTGSTIREIHQSVEPGSGPLEVAGPSMPFSSPAPLENTWQTDGTQESAAVRLSRDVHQHIGSDSQIFFFASRWWSESLQPEEIFENPLEGLTLHDLDGEFLLDLQHVAVHQPGLDGWAGCTVNLDPGTYRLRLHSPVWGTLEQAVVASPGWQTQLFLQQSDQQGGMADLATASILQTNVGVGFDPTRSDYRWTELARIGLVQGREVIPPNDLQSMLEGKFGNPMLGLYGAHALLMEAQPDLGRLQRIIDNLEGLLGTHPDVEALKLALPSERQDDYRYESPPMLSASWSLVVQASLDRTELVPEESLAALVSPHLWGASAWLIWLGDQLGDGLSAEDPSLSQSVEQLARVTAQVVLPDLLSPPSAIDLTDMEEAFLGAIAELQETEPSVLAETLGLPPSALREIGANLVSKLDLE